MLPTLSDETAAVLSCKTCQRYIVYTSIMQFDMQFDKVYFCGRETEPICSGGCDTHGECDTFCSHCGSCDMACECEKCSHCDEVLDSYGDCPNECCSNCGSSECYYCDECEEKTCNCSCYSSSDSCNAFGTIKVAPWVERGVHVEPAEGWSEKAALAAWGVDRTIDLAQAAADFYLLEALTGNIVNAAGDLTGSDSYLSLLRSEAKGLFATVVARLDRSFCGYLDMIIGGELRHHRAARQSTLRGDRKQAWNEWHDIRSAAGLSALSDAVEMFLDFNSSSYGGEPWANITKVLLARLSGKISPAVFVDRCWNLQHCGGSVFDKISWDRDNRQGWGLGELNAWVLPAHGAPNPWPILLSVASDEVRELFAEYWTQANRVKAAVGMRPERRPEPRIPTRSGYWGGREPHFEAIVAAGMILVH